MRRFLLIFCLFALTSFCEAADTRIADAAERDDLPAVTALIHEQADVNGTQGDGSSALHWAASRGNVEMLRLLLRSGAKVDAQTRVGSVTPLLMGAGAGNAAVAEVLLNAGANPNARNSPSGVTALMRAAAAGEARTIGLLLAHGADVAATDPQLGQTALMFAAGANRAEAVRLLISHGANPSVTSVVIKMGDPAVFNDINGFSQAEDLLLHDNIPPVPEAAQILAGRRTYGTVTGGMTALHVAARNGAADAARALVASGAEVNQLSAGDHSSPLLAAIVSGHFDLALDLVERGADTNLVDIDGLAPLYAVIDTQWAPYTGALRSVNTRGQTSHIDLMRALLEHGAKPDTRLRRKLWYRPPDRDQMWVGTPGSTAFWRAAQATDLPAMKLLIAHGADPRIASLEGDTALMMAAGIGWAGNFSRNATDAALDTALDAVKYCVELGLDVNTRDVTGYTALAGAAWRGDNALVEYLAAKGAKLDARTFRGWSVTDMATGPYLRVAGGTPHPETVELLKRLGAPEVTPHPNEDVLGAVKAKR